MNLKLLKNKNIFLLFFGNFISLMGTGIQNFALSLYVLKLTGSAAKFASVLAVTVIPQIILGPICGVFADWFDRKKIIVRLDALSGLLILSMAIVYKINGGLSMIYIYIIAIALSIISLLFRAAQGAVIPCLVGKEDIVKANSLNSVLSSIGQISAPLVSGVIYGFFGLFPILIINSVSFIASSISEIFIKLPKISEIKNVFNIQQFNKDFKEGFVYIKREKILLKIAICGFVVNFAFSPIFSVGLTYISKRVLFFTDFQYGMIETICGLGTILGALIVSIMGNKKSISKIFGISITSMGIVSMIFAIVIFMFYSNLILSKSGMFVLITLIVTTIVSIATVVNISLSSLLQTQTPKNMLGRVGAVISTLCTAAMPAGQMLIGGMFDATEAYIPIFISCAIIIIAGIFFSVSEIKSKINCERVTEQ